MIKIENLTLKIKNKTLLNNINLDIEENKTYLIIGPSGSSKTTLCNLLINKDNLSYDGNIYFNKNLKLGIDINMIFQDYSLSLNPLVKVKYQVIEALIYHKICKKNEALKKAYLLFEELNLDLSLLEKFPFELSGGEKQRVLIASSIITNPKLLICDEITSGLDLINEEKIFNILKKYNFTKLIISHNISLAKKIADYIVYMKDGKIIKIGSFKEILEINDEYTNALKFMENLKK